MIPVLLCVASILGANDDLTRVSKLGPVRVTTTLTPGEPTIGDEILLEIEVVAAADVDVLMPDFGEALSRYTILNYVPRQRVADDGSTVHRQRYTLQPYLSGKQSIPPILIEFVDHRPGQKPAPDDLDAYEILTERIDFQVKSVLPKNASGELNQPLGVLELTPSLSKSTWSWLAAAVVTVLVALVVTAIVWRSRRHRGLRRNAYEIAHERLRQLLARRMPGDASGIESFYVEISAIIRRYLEDRFDLRAPELTTEEFLGVAGSSGVLSHEHQKLLRDFLRQADLVKFAGIQASEQEIHRSTDLAAQFLEETRENAPWIDAPDRMADGASERLASLNNSPEAVSRSHSHSDADSDAKEAADV